MPKIKVDLYKKPRPDTGPVLDKTDKVDDKKPTADGGPIIFQHRADREAHIRGSEGF